MTVPCGEALGLDPRRLPAEVFHRVITYAQKAGTTQAREEAAWNSFGQPGRDPGLVGDIAVVMAHKDGWDAHLQMARLRNGWSGIVGEDIARRTTVVSLEEVVLTIRAESTVWSTQLSFMAPQFLDVLSSRLPDLGIRRIVVTGPRPDHGRRGMRYMGRKR